MRNNNLTCSCNFQTEFRMPCVHIFCVCQPIRGCKNCWKKNIHSSYKKDDIQEFVDILNERVNYSDLERNINIVVKENLDKRTIKKRHPSSFELKKTNVLTKKQYKELKAKYSMHCKIGSLKK